MSWSKQPRSAAYLQQISEAMLTLMRIDLLNKARRLRGRLVLPTIADSAAAR